MLPTLDARLAAAAELVRPGEPVADIGCDHGKLTAVLAASGKYPKVIGADLRPGPLAKAEQTLEHAGCKDRAELRLGDGLSVLNTLYVIVLTLLIVLPLGVGAAVYLTEYASNRRLIEVIEFTNETLAGIPSIIYGLVGMLVFSQALGFQTCLLSGSLTLVVMNLPTIIRTTQESLKTVPQGYREGAMGLGAGKWHIIRTIVLPCSIDGIVTGCILAVGRIVGESAALLFTAGAAEVIAKGVAKAYTSNGATLSVLLYLRAFEDGDFASAWGIGAVLLVLVLAINLAARLAKTKLKQKQ